LAGLHQPAPNAASFFHQQNTTIDTPDYHFWQIKLPPPIFYAYDNTMSKESARSEKLFSMEESRLVTQKLSGLLLFLS
jgi:hypothetical protein